MSISTVLKERRKQLNYTLLDIANKMGVSEATVQRWESGNIKNLRQGRIVELAEVLEIAPAYLVGWMPKDAVQNNHELNINEEVFGLKISGNSMEPRIYDGDLVIVKRQSDVESGEIGVVDIEGGRTTTKKIIKQEGGILLVGLNSAAYTPKFYPDGEYVIVGKVLEVRGNMDAFIKR